MANKKQSSTKMTTLAAKVLNNDNASKPSKRLAGSVLSQARSTKKK
jgi:hypothetical protein